MRRLLTFLIALLQMSPEIVNLPEGVPGPQKSRMVSDDRIEIGARAVIRCRRRRGQKLTGRGRRTVIDRRRKN